MSVERRICPFLSSVKGTLTTATDDSIFQLRGNPERFSDPIRPAMREILASRES
jgi:hypothetical protein